LLSASFAIGNLFVAAVVLTLERKLKVESRGNGLTLLSDRCIIEFQKPKRTHFPLLQYTAHQDHQDHPKHKKPQPTSMSQASVQRSPTNAQTQGEPGDDRFLCTTTGAM
jgi:hypothetical protein